MILYKDGQVCKQLPDNEEVRMTVGELNRLLSDAAKPNSKLVLQLDPSHELARFDGYLLRVTPNGLIDDGYLLQVTPSATKIVAD